MNGLEFKENRFFYNGVEVSEEEAILLDRKEANRINPLHWVGLVGGNVDILTKGEGLTFVEGKQYKDSNITNRVLTRPMNKSFGQFYYDGKPISSTEAFQVNKTKARILTGQLMSGVVSDVDEMIFEPIQSYIKLKIHRISQKIAKLNGM